MPVLLSAAVSLSSAVKFMAAQSETAAVAQSETAAAAQNETAAESETTSMFNT